jgi:hypothetical protein
MFSREFFAFREHGLFLRFGSGMEQEQHRNINSQSHE